jgi:hypothetical protein
MKIMNYARAKSRAAGRRLLKALLPKAQEVVDKTEMCAVSAECAVMLGGLNMSELEAVLIHHVPEGWFDEVVFIRGDGSPLILGTPLAKPWPSRQQAQDHAIFVLAGILANSTGNPTQVH